MIYIERTRFLKKRDTCRGRSPSRPAQGRGQRADPTNMNFNIENYLRRKISIQTLTRNSRYIMAFEIIFYRKESGRSPVEDFILRCNEQEKVEIVAHLDVLSQLGFKARRPLVDYLEDGIYELRIRVVKKQIRVLYFFFHQDKIVITNAFVKKSTKIYVKEIEKAKRFREDFTSRSKSDGRAQ